MSALLVRVTWFGAVAVTLSVLAACGGEEALPEVAATDLVETDVAPAETAPAATTQPKSKPKARLFRVARVIDGDTIELRNGTRVRLVQIDSPEVGDECYAGEATEALSRILPQGTKVRLAGDPKLDDVDRYDRLLRYVFKGKKNVNLLLVQRGAASVWFYQGDEGRYASKLLTAAKKAKAAGRGLWGACPGTKLNPTRAVATQYGEPEAPPAPPAEEPPSEPAQNCHPSYEGACLDPSATDYDCAGGEGNGPKYTGTVRVVGPDVFGLDGDSDGIGCE